MTGKLLPEIYTPEEAAEKLGITYHGKPNPDFILKAIRNGELECIKYSAKYIRITQEQLIAYQEEKKCREEIKAPKSKKGKTRVSGGSVSTKPAIDIGTLAASKQSQKLRKSLQSSSANKQQNNNVVSLTQSV